VFSSSPRKFISKKAKRQPIPRPISEATLCPPRTSPLICNARRKMPRPIMQPADFWKQQVS
jgi:hypothetical protein